MIARNPCDLPEAPLRCCMVEQTGRAFNGLADIAAECARRLNGRRPYLVAVTASLPDYKQGFPAFYIFAQADGSPVVPRGEYLGCAFVKGARVEDFADSIAVADLRLAVAQATGAAA